MEVIKDFKIIKSVIDGKFEQKEDATIWQNLGDGNRHEMKAKCYRIDDTQQALWFLVKGQRVGLVKVLPVYIYFHERKIIFKSKSKFVGENKIAVSMPNEIQLTTSRKEGREIVFDSDKTIRYHLGRDTNGVNFPYSAKVFDQSSSGLGVVVNSYDANRFMVDDFIALKKESEPQKVARIVHTSLLQSESSDLKQYHIGLQYL